MIMIRTNVMPFIGVERLMSNCLVLTVIVSIDFNLSNISISQEVQIIMP